MGECPVCGEHADIAGQRCQYCSADPLPAPSETIKLVPDTVTCLRVLEGDICLKCGGHALDTGWECNDCGFDHYPIIAALPGWPDVDKYGWPKA